MIEIRTHGRGGQGSVVFSKLLANTHAGMGYHVQCFPRFGVERRGAPVEAFNRADLEPIWIRSQIYEPDHVVVIDPTLIGAAGVAAGLAPGGWVVLNTTEPPESFRELFPRQRIATVDAAKIAVANGLGTSTSPVVNTAMLGAVARVFELPLELAESAIARMDEIPKPDANRQACREAWEAVVTSEEMVASEVERPAAPAAKPRIPELPRSFEPLSMRENLTGSWRYLRPLREDRVPPCNTACPAGNDVQGFVALVAAGKLDDAHTLLLQTTPFPGVCGRVCPAPCIGPCNRREIDEPVNVPGLERLVADHGGGVPPARRPGTGLKVAIVGAGPAGLSAAYQLALLGHTVTVFESEAEPGGVLRYGIPPFRLPRRVVREEVARITELGVEIRTGVMVGRDLSFDELRRGHDAVAVTIGLGRGRALEVPGEDLPGVVGGLDLLRELARGNSMRVGDRVAVIGGGNTAIDVSRSLVRLGRDVTLIYRRSREEMPAIADEVREAEEEGVEMVLLASPVRVLADEGGRVQALVCVQNELGPPDASGRRRPVPIPDSELVIEIDTVVSATGQEADPEGLPSELLTEGQLLEHREWQAAADPAVFAGGDVVTNAGTVVAAIGHGHMLASSIHHQLTKRPARWPRTFDDADIVRPAEINHAYFAKQPREAVRHVAPEERVRSFKEGSHGLADAREAERCLSCGVCNACDNCRTYCPDASVVVGADGIYRIDYDHCKGCAICAEECPRGGIVVTPEVTARESSLTSG